MTFPTVEKIIAVEHVAEKKAISNNLKTSGSSKAVAPVSVPAEDSVILSQGAQKMSNLSLEDTQKEFLTQKILALKQAISEGHYQPNLKEIAGKMIEESYGSSSFVHDGE